MPDALSITASSVDPGLLSLPWSPPLAEWPSSTIVFLPKGLSRHLVRFANLSGRVVAIKETTEEMARNLGVQRSTARTHVQNLLTKLGVHSRLQVAALMNAGGMPNGRPVPQD